MQEEQFAFNQDRFSVLYISRGRGRGHAMPDMAIGTHVHLLAADVEIKYASYSSGADTFKAHGHEVIDLKMRDDPEPWEALTKQLHLVGTLEPNLVVAHEECHAVVAAQVFGIPSIFITGFFMDPTSQWMQALKPAMEIIFIGLPGRFTEPPYLRDRIHYVGPAIRRLNSGDVERRSTRKDLEVSDDAVIVLFQPGNHGEALVPVHNVLLRAWDALPYAEKRLVWLAGADYDLLYSRFLGRPDIVVLHVDWQIDRLFAACDVVITKANRTTVFEVASLGIPSISISNGANWPDEVAISSILSNTMVNASSVTSEQLSHCIKDRLQSGRIPSHSLPRWSGVEGAATRLSHAIATIRGYTRADQ